MTEDFETLDLGAIRSKTRYGLREKPVRNKRYFCTTLLEGNSDNITNLREPPVVKSKRMSDRIIYEKKHAQKILKVYITKMYKIARTQFPRYFGLISDQSY